VFADFDPTYFVQKIVSKSNIRKIPRGLQQRLPKPRGAKPPKYFLDCFAIELMTIFMNFSVRPASEGVKSGLPCPYSWAARRGIGEISHSIRRPIGPATVCAVT
jgi:hypothetical protein